MGPAIVPTAGSTVTNVNYSWGFYKPHERNPGTISVWLCSESPAKCVDITTPNVAGGTWANGDLNYTAKGATSAFTGLPATTKFYYSYAWLNPDKAYDGLVMYGMRAYGQSTVNVSYQGL